MGKQLSISLRVDEETMNRFANAARTIGQDLTTFLLEAAERSAKNVRANEGARAARELPAFFRRLCGAPGGEDASRYHVAGCELTRQLERFEPPALERDEWHQELERLTELVLPGEKAGGGWQRVMMHHRDDAAVLAWFMDFFPTCIDLVPRGRRDQFLAGVYQAFDDEVLGW